MVAQVVEEGGRIAERLDLLRRELAAIPIDSYAAQTPNEARRNAAALRALESMLRAHVGVALRAVERLVPARDTRQLLAGDFGLDPGAAHRELRASHAAAAAHVAEQAAAVGEISHTHATVIGLAMRQLPPETSDSQRRRAELVLIDDAKRLSPKDLEARARRITEVHQTDEAADAHENSLLVEREAHARERASLAMWDNRDGTWSGRFLLPELQARMLKTVVDAFAAPRRNHIPAGTTRLARARAEAEQDKPYDRKAGEALMALVEHLPTDGLPTTGGTPARIIVTIDEAKLRSATAAATLATGERLSAAELRRLACAHGLLPAVLGGAGVPVDLGRSQRLFTPSQRDALASMDGGCVTPGCDRPPAWCEAHHGGLPFADGGRTNLDEGFLLCSAHHHEAHRRRWRFRRGPAARAEVDRGQGWERNHRYRP